MKKSLTVKNQEPTIPGIGASGLVMCPLFKGACLKNGCELWVELKQGEIFVARCSLSWLSILATETKEAVRRLKDK